MSIEIMDFKQACTYLRISKSLLYKLTSSRLIKFTKPNNGKLYFTKEVLDAWLMQNEHKSIDDTNLCELTVEKDFLHKNSRKFIENMYE